ncbi:hypothetical protein SAMN04488012_10645 [Palleronia salina]|uniref:Uncharacterized protein n=2 Tax=Palleronia TaxID=315422 RepID=A0A1M6HK27_9RHOB|nr:MULTISPECIES: hypothetical protein [Palleronia]SEM72741.1 hypothetical protein SAMN04488011_101256 [Palleronia pelagia]SHJ22553.1 hypothetical protein SAMN04488012_10645 [Palleronia salina]
MQTDDMTRLMAFARHVGRPDTDPRDTAMRRGWLTRDGALTEDGRATLKSLAEQDHTRTVFRGNF